MDPTAKQTLISVLPPLVSGGLAGALFSFGANSWLGKWRRYEMRRKLRFEMPVIAANRSLSIRVVNGSPFPLTCCWAYITIDHELSDVLRPPQGKSAHINDGHPLKVLEDRLCWSINPNTPPMVDILPGEWQSLQVLEFDQSSVWVAIFAETRGHPYRVFLRGGSKVYTGTLKIVCMETRAVTIPIKIDISDIPGGSLTKNFLQRG